MTKTLPADPKDRVGFSGYVTNGRLVYKGVVDLNYMETNKMFRTDYPTPD